MPDPAVTSSPVAPPGQPPEQAKPPTAWYLRWYTLGPVVVALSAYLYFGGPRFNGRVVAAVLGDNVWVQGVAGWLWFFTIGALYDRAGAGTFGSARGRKIAQWTASIMLFVAWTMVPLGGGAGAGSATGEIAGGTEAAGFALGLRIALPTTGIGYWLANRRKWRDEKLDQRAVWKATADSWKYGFQNAASGRRVLHPEWLKPDDRPAYARVIRDEHLVPAEDITPFELEILEDGLRRAGRAPAHLLTPKPKPKPRRRRRKPPS